MRRTHSILEKAQFLIVLGLLAGALGGLAIGLVTSKTASTGATATTGH